MESFFQAALNSVLEAAVGSSRSGRTSTADGSTNNIGATRTNSSTGTTGGIASRSGGNVHRSSRPTETSGATSARSGNPNAVQGTRCEPANRDQAQNTSFDQPGQPNKNGSSNNFTGGKRSGNSSSSSKGVSNPDSQNPRGNSQVRDRQAADRLKDLGNESFRRGMYGLAAEYYSKAIEVDATVASYFTNRALCHKREKRYPEALEDAEAALALDETNVKGLYIKGDALVQLGNALRAPIACLSLQENEQAQLLFTSTRWMRIVSGCSRLALQEHRNYSCCLLLQGTMTPELLCWRRRRRLLHLRLGEQPMRFATLF